jgi:predicted permease
MPRLGRPGRELRSFLWRSSIDEQLDAELSFHVEMLLRELTERGLSHDAARAEAMRRFGNVGSIHAICRRIGMQGERERRRTEYLGELWQDIVYALRQLAKAPGFSFVAILTLALGIGATTALFSAVQSVVLRRFAFAHPERTMLLVERWQDQDGSVSVGNFVDWKAASRSFEAMAAQRTTSFSMAEGETPERVLGARVSHEYFDVFGVRPILGRTFSSDEDVPGQESVVLLSENVWTRSFGADPRILGRTIRLNARPYTVIGVMPRGFDPLLGGEEMWVPIAFTPEQRAMHDEHYLNVVGLLKPTVTPEQTNAELAAVSRDLAEKYPKDVKGRVATAYSLPRFLVGNFRERLFIFLGAVSFVLLIACGNVANLLLARGEGRSKEIAIRSAIGAGRGRIVRQLLTESVVLGVIASIVGLGLAWSLVRVLIASAPEGIPRIEETRIDGVVAAFALGLALLSSLLFGFAPALRAARQDLQSILKEGGRGAVAARDHVRNSLVIAEVTLALTLLVGAGLLIKSSFYLQRIEPGFDTRGVLTARLSLPDASYRDPDQIVRTFRDIVDRVRQGPGVVAAAITSQAPLGAGGNSNGLVPEGQVFDPVNVVNARLRMISPEYISAMRIPLKRGRLFNSQDVAGAQRVMIVSEGLAKRLWPNEDPIGKRLACCEGAPDDPRWKTVVGVVGDVRSQGPTVDPAPEFYMPMEQMPPEAWRWIQNAMTIVARSATGDGSSLIGTIRQSVRAVDPSLPLYRISTMNEAVRQSTAQVRFNTMLLTVLGVIGALLAAIGIYSVIAYFVNLRTHEIGIRMALGATGGDIVKLMTWQGMRPVLIGIVLGAATAYGTTRLLQGSLYGVTPTDPATFVSVVVALVFVGALASAIPARRATRVEPTKALQM